jgi:DNA-binding NarL/FixJ family response regulator
MSKISVLLADDHAVVRFGLRSILAAESDIEVVGEAENGRQAVQMAQNLRPNVIVMDLAMPQLNGMEAIRQIVSEGLPTKVLILSSYSDDEYVHQLTEAGASGYLVKQSAAKDLVKAVRETHKGNAYFSPSIARRLLEYYRVVHVNGRSVRQVAVKLTSREQEVLQLVAEGHPNKQIADILNLSIKTVEKHRQHLMNKLNIHEIAGLTRYAMANGVIEAKQRIGQPSAPSEEKAAGAPA